MVKKSGMTVVPRGAEKASVDGYRGQTGVLTTITKAAKKRGQPLATVTFDSGEVGAEIPVDQLVSQ